MFEIVPNWQTLGFELLEAEPGRAVFAANVRWRRFPKCILRVTLPPSTCNSLIYEASLEGKFRAIGKCVKAGKTVLFSEAQFSTKRRLVCTEVSSLLGNSMATQGLSSVKTSSTAI